MAALADVFAAVRLQLDGTGFEAQATALADKQGKNVGERMSNQLNSKLKTAAAGALGMAAGAAFGVMLTGANQLDAATRRLQADTGMTADEATRAQGALAGMYRDNLQGFDAIGAAMARVHNDLGLIGDAADATTEKFLKFSTATGQDAAAAVASFDDILDAWNLSAADAGGLMDKLIVSHQKYGGVITESQSALAAMAPAMQAANMSIDDGIALLNLFNATGIDAAKAPAALAKAVKQLKPGQGLNDLIAQLGAIEDPTKRGQKAMEIFGARSGIGLAQAIKPGMTSLADLTASLGDTTDATNIAAEATLSWGDKATLTMHKIGGALAEIGTQFGPLLMVAAMFGPKLVLSIGAGLGGLAGLFATRIPAAIMAAVIPASVAADVLGVTAGTAAGTAFGTALTVAATAAAIAAPVAIILTAQGPVADWLGLSGKQTGPAGTWSPKLGGPFKVPVPVELVPGHEDASAEAFRKYLQDTKAKGLKGLDYSEWKKNAAAGGAAAGAAAGNTFAAGVKLTAKKESIDAAEVYALFGSSLEGVRSAASSTGIAGMEALAAGITAARSKPVDAFTTMTEMLKNAMTPTAEAARLAGQLTSEEMAAGLRSKDPAVKAQAIAVRRMIIERLAEIKKDSGGIGKGAMDELDEGIRSKDPQIRSAARAAKEAVIEELDKAKPLAATAGENVGQAFGAALAARVRAAIANMVGQSAAPRAPEGRASGGPVYAGVPYIVGEYRRPELFVPEVNGRMLSSVPAAFQTGQSAGAREQHINIEHVEIRDAHDEFSLTQQLRFLAAVG